MARAVRYEAVCAVCYTCVVGSGTKKDAERAAVSHINVYGHNVSIITVATVAR